MPEEGTPKAPNTPDNPRVGQRLKDAGQAAGVNFTGKCDRAPNSIKAHALLRYAAEHKPEVQHELSGLLFKMYFEDGDYPDAVNLAVRAAQVGLNKDDVLEFLAGRSAEAAVQQEAAGYSRQGVTGVPFFIFNGQPAFSGAQNEETFLRAFEKAATST
jgi:predicted DsbA family dithiol-disulfide isomerase